MIPANQEKNKKNEGSPDKALTLNKSFEKDIRKAILEPVDNDFVMELEEDDWPSENSKEKEKKNDPPPKEEPKAPKEKEKPEEKKINLPEIAKMNGYHDEKEEDKDDFVLKRKATNPIVRTVMSKPQEPDSDKFGMGNWAEFQDLLKANLTLMTNETRIKEKALKRIKAGVADYTKTQLAIKEKNELILKIRNHEQYHQNEVSKVLSEDPSQRLGNATQYVKELLGLIHDNPRIIALTAKNTENLTALRNLEETLAIAFYENIFAEDGTDHEVLRLFSSLLQAELNNVQKYADLLHPDLFFNRMWAAYLKRNECKAFIKTMLREPLLGCLREKSKIKLDAKEVKRDVDKKRQKAQKSSMAKAEKIAQNAKLGKSDAEAYFKEEVIEGSSIKDALRNETETIVPKFRKNKGNEGIQEEAKIVEKKFEMVFDGPAVSALRLIDERDVALGLEKNFKILKKHLGVLIQSIFDNLENMPMGLRTLCKIIYTQAKKKFPALSEKESVEILSNYLFRRWVCPNTVSPGYSGILDDFESSPDLAHNLVEITKALQTVFNLAAYPSNDIKSELNDYFREIMPSVQKYFKELISVNDEALQDILQDKPVQSTKVRSKAIYMSLYEIKILCECIGRQKEELTAAYPAAVALAERILGFDQSENIFTFGIDAQTGQAIRNSQLFLLFHEILLPKHLVSDYQEEFSKLVGFSKSLPEGEKVLCQAKHALKNFLVATKDIKTALKWSSEPGLTLDKILELHSDKAYCIELNAAKKNERTPIHISARFVIFLLSQLPDHYRSNNYYKLYQDMCEDFKTLGERLDLSISTIKLQLLKGMDMIKTKNEYLNEVKKERTNALKKENVWEFIKSLKIPMCVTSPSTMGSFLKDANKANAKKSKLFSDKIEVLLRNDKGCIHDQFSIMRELTISAGAIAIGNMKPKAGSKSMSQTASNSVASNPADDLSYHIETVDEFINLFGSLPEVRQAIVEGRDVFGVNNGIVFLYNQINEEVKNKYKTLEDEDINSITDEIENYICKKLYYLVFPSIETEADRKFWRKCKVLDWVNFDDLEIIPRNRFGQLWEYAAKTFSQIDNRITPAEKLQCMLECFKIITQVLDLASTKEGSGGSDETLPIMIYVILKACPKRIHTNLNFIEFLRDPKRMLAGEGFCYIQTKSAVMALQDSNEEFFRMEPQKYQERIQTKEIEHGFAAKK